MKKKCCVCGKKCDTFIEFPKRYLCEECHKTSMQNNKLIHEDERHTADDLSAL